MATALKDISFTTPVMDGFANSGGGTSYYFDFSDRIEASMDAGSGALIEYDSSNGWWQFHGVADSANSADTASAIGGSGASLSYADISAKLDCIVDGSGTYYFNGGLTNGGGSLSFSAISGKLNHIYEEEGHFFFNGGLRDDNGGGSISYSDISAKLDSIVGCMGAYYFKGGLQDSSGITTFLMRDDGCGQYTPVINIGQSTYDLSVDSNGFVKATVNK